MKLSAPRLRILTVVVGLAVFCGLSYLFISERSRFNVQDEQLSDLSGQNQDLQLELAKITADFEALKAEDQVIKNNNLEAEIASIQKTYQAAVAVYEKILDYKGGSTKKIALEVDLATALDQLSTRNYASAGASLAAIEQKLEEEIKAAAAVKIPENVPESNSPPASGYSQQKVTTGGGSFLVDIISADLGSTRIIVDTASDGDCGNNCPVLSLADYVSRNGAFAGINGSYFCPAEYPSCAGKTNSFDTLLMNKNKVYFNSGNNVYSTVPAVIFGGGWIRFVGQSLEWGRDTGIDGMIANRPLLVAGGNVVYGGGGDAKWESRGPRNFVANRGNNVFIGIVRGATLAEAAGVLQALGMENGLNLDSGGSSALWAGGYKYGPGRSIPNAILLVRK